MKMQEVKVKVGNDGGIFMPVEYQEMIDLKSGDEVVITLDEGEVRIVIY
jgi:bifunctional DNA-binding transcriptional regulator/antitoxin component of YhaV-PrlF toxin-antitoxin module